MLIFALAILISIVMYIYYKVMILRTKDYLVQVYFNSKARFFLGTFLIAFGINQYLAYQFAFVLIISIIFILLGGYQSYHGFKAARHYNKEWKRLNE